MDCTEYLVESIKERNKGNFQKSLEILNYCKTIDNTDTRIYENTYKVEFFRKNFDFAFRNLLILMHIEIITDPVRNHPIGQMVYEQELVNFFTKDELLFDNKVFESELIKLAIVENPLLQNIIFMGNSITYRIGHSFIGMHLNTNILNAIKNRNELFDNYNYRITDRNKGDSFFTIGYKNYFVCIGFIFAHMNLNFNLKNKVDIINYYLGDDFNIMTNIWDYREFLLPFNSNMRFKEKEIIEDSHSNIIIDYIISGTLKFYNNDYYGAIDDFTAKIQLDNNNDKAYSYRAETKEKIQDYNGAIEDYSNAIRINPLISVYYIKRAEIKHKVLINFDLSDIISDYEIAIKLNPFDFDTILKCGENKMWNANFKGALIEFTKAIELNSDSFEAYNNRGVAKNALQDYHSAISDFNKAIKINPMFSEAYYNRAIQYDWLNDYQAAIDDYTKVIEINTNFVASAYYERGMKRNDIYDYKNAIKDFDKAIEIEPNRTATFLKGKEISKQKLGINN